MEGIPFITQGNTRRMTSDFQDSIKLLREYLKHKNDEVENAIQQAYAQNPWFIPEFCHRAIDAIADQYLDVEKVRAWLKKYSGHYHVPKRIGIVMAGNIPLVGFHDLISVLASGHHAMIKLSDKDAALTQMVTNAWIHFYPALADRISFTSKLQDFDAVIATGSNNTARYFEYYFRNYPHILRANRNGVAVLTGQETIEELMKLADDIFLYFGLGCRNVSKIYVPDGYDFKEWPQAITDWAYLSDHTKYRHNLDYNLAIFQINNIPHHHLGHLTLKEDDLITSRIGCLHYSFYRSPEELQSHLESHRKEVQCVVSSNPVDGWEHIYFGQTQMPALDQYADQVDTMVFLTSLS